MIEKKKDTGNESVSHAMSTIERMGKETGLWDTTPHRYRGFDQEEAGYNPGILITLMPLFFTGGDLEMDDQRS